LLPWVFIHHKRDEPGTSIFPAYCCIWELFFPKKVLITKVQLAGTIPFEEAICPPVLVKRLTSEKEMPASCMDNFLT
jgi:hypothetical protein